jgi:hypothetical protein
LLLLAAAALLGAPRRSAARGGPARAPAMGKGKAVGAGELSGGGGAGDGAGASASTGAGAGARERDELCARVAALERELRVAHDEAAVTAAARESDAAIRAELEGVRASESEGAVEDVRHQLAVARERIRWLEVEQSGLDVLKAENERYAALVLELQGRSGELELAKEAQVSGLKKDLFSARIQLENTFRRTMQEMDRKHHEQAFRDLDAEGKAALIEKARAQDELLLQKVGIEALTNRYEKRAQYVRTLKTDVSVLQEHQAMQAAKIAALRRETERLSHDAVAREAELAATREKADAADLLRDQFAALAGDLDAALLRADAEKARADRYKDKLRAAAARVRELELRDPQRLALSPNQELLKSLTELGNAAKASLDRVPLSPGHNGAAPHNFVSATGAHSMRESASMPALRQSQYKGILESWNNKFAGKAAKPGALSRQGAGA